MEKMLLNPKKNKINKIIYIFICIIMNALTNYDTINETMVNMLNKV